jgi:hypothetical protein
VASPALFAIKAGGTMCAANGVGEYLYWRETRRSEAGRDLPAGELEICWEVPALPVKHLVADRPHSDNAVSRDLFAVA